MTEPTIVVAGVILDDQGRVLRARRRPEKRDGGLWEFPGGKVEVNESLAEALEREINEELSVRVMAGEVLCETVAGTIRLVCVWAMLQGDAPQSSTDHDLLEWVVPLDLPPTGWCEPDLPAVGLLRSGALPQAAGN